VTLFRHFRNICFVALVVGLVSTTLGPLASVASADPIADKEAQAKALQDQIEATNEKISALGERYNGAQLRLNQAEQTLAEVQAKITATQDEITRIQTLVEKRAASVYRRILGGKSLDNFAYADAEHLLTRKKYAEAQAKHDDALLAKLSDARQTLTTERKTVESARAAAATERQQIVDTKAALDTGQAQQQALLGQVQGELAQLVAQELARRQAEAAAMANAKLQGGDGDPNLPPPGPAAAKAVQFALAQMGKTYVYAAAGPDHFDCSGLVMAAFESAGVSLPHYSGAQYAKLPHVPLTAVQPGDLIFWGSGGSVHVAFYYGNARLLESGGSGHDVHIGPIWGHPTGAARVLS
jgi:cell wall-associated NlpC family hydrolase